MRETTASLDLEHTRAAFDSWRSTQPRRGRIPEHLWLHALALLAHYPISRVAQVLRLDYKQLRQRQLSAARLPVLDASQGPNFIELPAADFNGGTSSHKINFNSPPHIAETGLRLVFERNDGCRLTLCLPASDWDRLTALCTDFIRR
jgi:hypothetical protein